MFPEYDVIVVGAGHAGAEAAVAIVGADVATLVAVGLGLVVELSGECACWETVPQPASKASAIIFKKSGSTGVSGTLAESSILNWLPFCLRSRFRAEPACRFWETR